MGKIYTQTINRFDGGISNDLRSKSYNKFAIARHFDVFSYPHKLVPQFSADSKETGGDFASLTVKPYKFFYDNGTSIGNVLFGLGKISGGKAAILYWDNNASEWKSPAGNVSSSGAVADGVFFNYYGYAYFWADGSYLQRYKLDGSAGLDEAFQTVATTSNLSNVCQPVHCRVDDIAYFFTGNLVCSLTNADAWTNPAFTLPTGTYVTAACEYQDYLVIAVNYTTSQKSTIFFWNRDTSQTTATYRYDFDNRDIYQMKVIDGKLMVVSSDYTRVYIDRYNGAEFQTINELVGARTTLLATSSDYTISRENAVVNNKLLFPMDYTATNGTNNSRLGIWALGSDGKISLDYIVNGATSYQGICYLYGDLWIAYNNANVVRTNISFSTDVTSDYETLMLEGSDKNKKLLSVGVSTEPLPTAGQITLKYRLRNDTTWTSIFIHNTDDSYYYEAVNADTDLDGVPDINLPEFREIQFKVESIGGAVLTGLTYKYELINDNPSD